MGNGNFAKISQEMLSQNSKFQVFEDAWVVPNFLSLENENILLSNLTESKDKFLFRNLRSGKRTASFGGAILQNGNFIKDENGIPNNCHAIPPGHDGAQSAQNVTQNDCHALGGLGWLAELDG